MKFLIRKRTAVIGGIILSLLVAGTTFIGTSVLFLMYGNIPFLLGGMQESSEHAKIKHVKQMVQQYYVEPVDQEVLLEGAIRGVVAALKDPYSRYMSRQEYAEMMEETSRQYTGIGVVITVDSKDNLIKVVSPFEGSPGEKAGILPGDKIIKVDGVDVRGDKLGEAVNMLRGPAKTDVVVTIVRGDMSRTQDITITRNVITIDTVSHKIVDGDIGYIRINRFYQKTSNEFSAALDELYAQDIQGLIIDVRNNPGGLLPEVVKITDRLVPEGIIVYTEDREKKQQVFYSREEETDLPLAILINGGSASASEILAGAVRDHKKGVLIGDTTFGKGVVQVTVPIYDGSGIIITTSQYYTPNGISIHKKGVEPDVKIIFPEDFEQSITQITEEEDVQLQKAIEVIRQQFRVE